jgi:hypothetical protein
MTNTTEDISNRYGDREQSREKLENVWNKATEGEAFAKQDPTDTSLLETSFLELTLSTEEHEDQEIEDKKLILFVARDPGGIRRVLPIIENLTTNNNIKIYGLFDNFAKEEFLNKFDNDTYRIIDHSDEEQPEDNPFKPDLLIGCRSASGGKTQRQSLILSAMATYPEATTFLYEDAYNTVIEPLLELKKRGIPLPNYVGVQTPEEVDNIKKALELEDTTPPNYRYFIEDHCLIGNVPPVETLPLVIRGLVPGASSTKDIKNIIQNWIDNPDTLKKQQIKAEEARQNLGESSFESIINNLINKNTIDSEEKDNFTIVEIGETGKERLKEMNIEEARANSREKLIDLYNEEGFNEDSKLITYVSTDVANYENEIGAEIYNKINDIVNKDNYTNQDLEELVVKSKKFEKIYNLAKSISKLETRGETVFFILRQHPRDEDRFYKVYDALFNKAFKNTNLKLLPNTAKDGLNTSQVVQASTASITTWSGMLGEMAVTGPAIAWIDATIE